MNAVIDQALEAPTRFLEVNGTSYAYRRFGRPSQVPLVGFQHFTGTLDNWDPALLNGLAEAREVIIFDNAGVGSSGGQTPDKVAGMTADAVAFLRALQLEQIDVLGFSLGGFIAQQLAVQHPALVRKVILVGTAPQGAQVLRGFPELIQKAMQLPPAERFLFIFFTGSAPSRAAGEATLQRLWARTEDRDRDASVQAVTAQINAITTWGTDPVTLDLSTLRQPVLIVQGSHDEMMASENAYLLYRQLPNAMLTYYPDAAHGSFFQYPELFVHQANYFLNHIH
ncbi:Pimeloyl-ACP methyl ester carboxylesterase [Catalinimonas alkaloidigena]|uniref:Pimeloyl-ACP methyl ester carboxylesterase n=1 Tax=Catalinimonas alkaloidigena TaxID=1075417 RepID=A0A1G9P4Y2_9BACT|nr:alpha/beta hydrolase [Catalinimonas alkaloidigena]SDL93769.1 Pimeloyl-ACP methyl ester carboxylesterase [Catalinimonas alkaloidigena]